MAGVDDESKALFNPDRRGSCRGLEGPADGPAVGGGGGGDLGRGGRGGSAVPVVTLAEDLGSVGTVPAVKLAEDLGRGGGEHALGLRGASVSID